jgi:hypothetical protein
MLRFAAVIGLILVSIAGDARADLSSDADLVTAVWRAHATSATRMPSLFLEHGRPRAIRLPASAYDASSPACTTIAVLAGRSVDFVVRIDPLIIPKHRPMGGQLEHSLAGTVVLVRCGEDRSALARLSLELRVARGAAEIIVAEGTSAAPSIASILPERATGPVAPPNDPGPRAPLEPAQERVDRVERQATRAGATSVKNRVIVADADGTGRERLNVDEGCHQIGLFATTAGRRPLDIDAEARDTVTERLVARDRSDSIDARLEFCVGASSAMDLVYAGAGDGGPVILSDAQFPLPLGVPVRWGARARAGFAAALRRRKLAPIESVPVREVLGASGSTAVPFEMDAGGCYVAATSIMHGDAHPLAMSVTLGTRATYDTNFGLYDGAVVAFCNDDSRQARIDIDARGTSLGWILAIWQVGSRDLDEQP